MALIATLPDFAELQRRLNAALAGNLPRTLRRSPQRMAADLVLIPYHGQPQHDPDEIYRSEAKSGTSHFHAYATLYVIRNGWPHRTWGSPSSPISRHPLDQRRPTALPKMTPITATTRVSLRKQLIMTLPRSRTDR